MQQNRVNVTLTTEQKAAIIAAVEALETAIPFRISLDNTERMRMLKLGQKSEGFVREALEAARNHPNYIPASISLEDLDRDEEVREVLLTCVQRVGALYTQLQDTATAAGSDLMKGATAIYRALRANAEGAGLDQTLGTLHQRFDRPSRKQTPPTEEPPVTE